MKKFVITCAVFGIFLIYSFGIRNQAPVLQKPSSLTSSGSTPSSSASTQNTQSTQGSSNSGNTSNSSTTQYNDGTYTGSTVNAYFGNVQVAVVVSGGKISNVKILQYPNSHSTSVYINQQAMPYLQQEVVQAQSPNVQVISGATFSSEAFIQSLTAALSKA